MLYEKIFSLIRLIRCSYKYMSMRKIISLIRLIRCSYKYMSMRKIISLIRLIVVVINTCFYV